MSTVHFYCVHCGSALQSAAESRYDLVKCGACARYVPVPRPSNGPGNFSSYPHVFPPDVLGLLVKFKCAACDGVLHADARYEGQAVICTGCGAHAPVPRWSNTPGWPLPKDAAEHGRQRTAQGVGRVAPPMLSPEEIEFLRGVETGKPEAAA
jgi:transcription elongation factor Elf1